VNNELNGANGVKIQIDWRDNAYDASKSNNIITEFMNIGDVLFTVMSSTQMTAVQEKANRAGFPGLVTFAANNNIIPPAHIYAHSPDYGDDWIAFTNYYLQNIWKGQGKPKMALLLLNNTTGSAVKDVADAEASTMGVDIIDTAEHSTTTISEIDTLTRIKAENPDVIYIASTPQPTSVILKNAKDLGMLTPNLTVGLGHAAIDKSLVDLAGADVVEGVYGVLPTVTWNDNAPGIAKVKEYAQKNHPGDVNKLDYLSTWNTTLIVAQILRNALQNVGYDALVKGDANAWKAVETNGIQKLNGYDVGGNQGPVSYVPGSNKLGTAIKIYQIRNGAITPVSGWIQAK
jgi:branched-chain amino acid transport system substrate-binding protein